MFIDSGVEKNLNEVVDKLLEGDTLDRIVAQTEVSVSNSMIESWGRSLKHGGSNVDHFDSVATLRKSLEFYVAEHIEVRREK